MRKADNFESKQSTLFTNSEIREIESCTWKLEAEKKAQNHSLNIGLESIEENGFTRRRPGEYTFKKSKCEKNMTVLFFYFQFLSRLTLMFDKARTKGHVQLLMKRCKLTLIFDF